MKKHWNKALASLLAAGLVMGMASVSASAADITENTENTGKEIIVEVVPETISETTKAAEPSAETPAQPENTPVENTNSYHHGDNINWYIEVNGQIRDQSGNVQAQDKSNFTGMLTGTGDYQIGLQAPEYGTDWVEGNDVNGNPVKDNPCYTETTVNNAAHGAIAAPDADNDGKLTEEELEMVNTAIRDIMMQHVYQKEDGKQMSVATKDEDGNLNLDEFDKQILAEVKAQMQETGGNIVTVNGKNVDINLIDDEYYEAMWYVLKREGTDNSNLWHVDGVMQETEKFYENSLQYIIDMKDQDKLGELEMDEAQFDQLKDECMVDYGIGKKYTLNENAVENADQYAGDVVFYKEGTKIKPANPAKEKIDLSDKDTYEFDGWYVKDSNGKESKLELDANGEFTLSGNMVLFGKWTVKGSDDEVIVIPPERNDDDDDDDDDEDPIIVPDPDVPLAELPEEEVPLSEEPAEELTELADEEVPMADVPETGDASALWIVALAVSALGLAWTVVSSKKKAV